MAAAGLTAPPVPATPMPTSLPPRPITPGSPVPTAAQPLGLPLDAPAAVVASRFGWQQAVIGSAPMGAMQIILGTEAYHWSNHLRRGNKLPDADLWQDLSERARRVGLMAKFDGPGPSTANSAGYTLRRKPVFNRIDRNGALRA